MRPDSEPIHDVTADSREDMKPRLVRGRGGAGAWQLAAGGACLMLAVIAIGAVALYFGYRQDGPTEREPEKKPAATKANPPDPAGLNPRFRKMADRLAGRWEGELPQGGSITYDYRADGTFTLAVQRPGMPLTVNGTWRVVGIGAWSGRCQSNGRTAAISYPRSTRQTNTFAS